MANAIPAPRQPPQRSRHLRRGLAAVRDYSDHAGRPPAGHESEMKQHKYRRDEEQSTERKRRLYARRWTDNVWESGFQAETQLKWNLRENTLAFESLAENMRQSTNPQQRTLCL